MIWLALCAPFAFLASAATALAQVPPDAGPPPRVDIGGGYTIVAPTGPGWQQTGSPASYYKPLGAEGHGLAVIAATGPSGITRQEIIGAGESKDANALVKLVSRFVGVAWKRHAAGLQEGRFEVVDTVNEMAGKGVMGDLVCAYSRIVARDRGAVVDGAPARLRYVGYTCIEFPDMTVAAHVSYSERGREQDLSDAAMAEGERTARSLQRRK